MIFFSDFGATVTLPTFVATGTADGATAASSIAPGYPAGLAANDILFLFVIAEDSSGDATISTPAGWTAISNFYHPLNDSASGLFWKRATGSESGTQTVNTSESVNAGVVYGVISAYRGCAASGDPFERHAFNYVASGTEMRAKGLTTAGPARKVVTFSGHPSAITGANVSAWAEDFDGSTAVGGGATIGINSVDQASAGKVLRLIRTLSVADSCLCHTIALVPVGETAGSADLYADVLFQMQASGANGSTTFIDDSHYGIEVTPAGDAQVQSSKLELDGTGDWLTSSQQRRVPWRLRNDQYTASEDFTIDVWGAEIDTLAANRTLVSYWDGSATNNRSWGLQVTSAGNVTFFYSVDGTATVTPINYAAGITTGVSNNYRVVRSISAQQIYLYINGTKVATAALLSSVNFFGATSQLVVGSLNTLGSAGSTMDGRLSAVRLTRRALTTGASYTVESLPIATS